MIKQGGGSLGEGIRRGTAIAKGHLRGYVETFYIRNLLKSVHI